MIRIVVGVAVVALSTSAAAQTAYYNTDRGRPVQIEDAYATERHAFEMKLAPVRVERAGGGLYSWVVEPELAYGVFPRTQLEIGLPVSFSDIGGGRTRVGIAGLEASLMHNLNTETSSLPALGFRGDVIAPVGSASLGETYASLTGLATRTLSWARFHLNGQYTIGKAPANTTLLAADVSRWLGGVAVDKTFPLRAMLVTVETYARGPMQSGQDVEYTAGGGIRYQWSPLLAVDAGLGRRFTGDNPAWFITFGSAYSFGIASLIPGLGR
jgi:hypothetical protein